MPTKTNTAPRQVVTAAHSGTNTSTAAVNGGEPGVDGQISGLIRQLGAQSWAHRESAQAQLLKLGDTQTDLLLKKTLRASIASEDPEVAHRARQVVEVVVMQTVHKNGFVGIQISQPASPVTVRGRAIYPLRVDRVIPDTAAVTNGLSAGDLILQTDEHFSDLEFGVQDFIYHVARKAPGENPTLRIMSAGTEVKKDISLGRRPPSLQGAVPIEVRKRAFLQSWLERNTDAVERRRMQGR